MSLHKRFENFQCVVELVGAKFKVFECKLIYLHTKQRKVDQFVSDCVLKT